MKQNPIKQMLLELKKEAYNREYKTTMLKDAKNKKGLELERGESVVLEFPEDRPMFVHIYRDGSKNQKLVVLTKNLYKYVKGATKPPSMSAIERMVDGTSKSVLGKRVEPDGHDEYGSPSWLLVLGFI